MMQTFSLSPSPPLVTVLMPVFNAAPYIEEAVESILQQTCNDFEFLIIDDGSTDNSAELVATCDSRIRMVRNQANRGLVRTLNDGIAQARGKYIARMDADDISLPHRLARQVSFMEQFPEVGVCGAWLEAFDGKTRTVWSPPLEHDDIRCTLLFESVIYHPTVMIRKELLDARGLHYATDFPHAEDYELWSRMSSCCRLANLGEVLLRYRLHEKNIGKLKLHEQIKSASRVREALLLELGVVPTEEEMALHTALSLWQSSVSCRWLQDVREWLEKLLQANRQRQLYPEISFNSILAKRWYHVCLMAAPLGFCAYRTYADSLLSLHNRLPWSHRLGFLLRSLMKSV